METYLDNCRYNRLCEDQTQVDPSVEAERFVSILIREKSDYTKWRQRYFGNITSDEFHAAALSYGKNNPM